MTAKIKTLMALVLIAVAAACGGSDDADGGVGEPFVEDIKNLDDERGLPPIPLECFDSQESFEQCDDDGLLPDDCFDDEGFILPECDPTKEQGAESSELADDDGDIEPAVEPEPEVISSGFDPSVDAFGFENYGGEPGTVNLTTVEMQRMYGDEVCANLADGCTLSPPARQWMEQMNQAAIAKAWPCSVHCSTTGNRRRVPLAPMRQPTWSFQATMPSSARSHTGSQRRQRTPEARRR